ncbi:MAG TPA: plasmid pRiA4b ORF-3 family protein [Trebonia sp.]|nr:plasmid pRiA4b ORF-3 family protein [Trebonia sp.]
MPRTEAALDAILSSLLEQRSPLGLRGGAGQRDGAGRPVTRGGARRPVRPLPPLADGAATTVHRVAVTLTGSRPSVWRRLEVPSDLPLSVLHEVLQTAFGWFDCHPHQFETPCGEFGDPAQDDFWTIRRDECTAAVAQVAPAARDKLGYLYDFGASWRHDLAVEAITAATPGTRYPRCTALRGAPPDEDSGGIRAFNSLFQHGPSPSPADLTDALAGLAGVVVPAAAKPGR